MASSFECFLCLEEALADVAKPWGGREVFYARLDETSWNESRNEPRNQPSSSPARITFGSSPKEPSAFRFALEERSYTRGDSYEIFFQEAPFKSIEFTAPKIHLAPSFYPRSSMKNSLCFLSPWLSFLSFLHHLSRSQSSAHSFISLTMRPHRYRFFLYQILSYHENLWDRSVFFADYLHEFLWAIRYYVFLKFCLPIHKNV